MEQSTPRLAKLNTNGQVTPLDDNSFKYFEGQVDFEAWVKEVRIFLHMQILIFRVVSSDNLLNIAILM